MNNHDFNIINQLIQEQKSLWRIENHYIAEAKTADEKKFWKKMKAQKTKAIAELKELSVEERIEKRIHKYSQMGQYDTIDLATPAK